MGAALRVVDPGEISPDAMRAYRAAKALHRDGGSPASAFGLLAAIVEDRTWERLTDNHGRPFPSFTAFVEGAQPGGLGTTTQELRKLLELRHPHENVRPWVEKAPQLRANVNRLLAADMPAAGPVGRPQNVRVTHNSGTGPDTADRTVARLKRDDPGLAERVVSGEISPNAAAREKGWRKPRILLTSPESVAIKVRQHFTPEQVAQLIRFLSEAE